MRASQCISYYLNSLLCIQDKGYRPFLYLKGNYSGSLSRFYSLSHRAREQEKRGACSDLSKYPESEFLESKRTGRRLLAIGTAFLPPSAAGCAFGTFQQPDKPAPSCLLQASGQHILRAVKRQNVAPG